MDAVDPYSWEVHHWQPWWTLHTLGLSQCIWASEANAGGPQRSSGPVEEAWPRLQQHERVWRMKQGRKPVGKDQAKTWERRVWESEWPRVGKHHLPFSICPALQGALSCTSSFPSLKWRLSGWLSPGSLLIPRSNDTLESWLKLAPLSNLHHIDKVL